MTTPFPIFSTVTVGIDYWTEEPFERPRWYFEWTLAQFVFVAVLTFSRLGIGIVAVSINTALLISQFKQKMFLRTHFIFGITLTIAQIFFSVSLLLETLWYLLQLIPVPVVFPSLTIASTLLSNFSMIAVAVDRYLALYAIPFRYKQVVTIKKYGFIAVGITIFSIATGFLLMYGLVEDFENSSFSLFNLAVTMFIMLITATIYVTVGYYLSKSHKRLGLDAETKSRRVRQTRKIILTFTAMLISDLVLLLPLRLYTFYLWFQFQPGPLLYNTSKIVITSNVLYNLFAVNYIVNPIIYWRQMISDIFPALPCRRKKTEKPKKSTPWATKENKQPIKQRSGASPTCDE